MSEHHVPAGKLCPEFSTVQILLSEIAFQATSQAQKGMNLAGLKGMPSASSADTSISQGKAVIIHKDPILPEGVDPNKPVDISKISKFRGQPISVPCIQDKCGKWCAEHGAVACIGGGCRECALEVMKKAFDATTFPATQQENPA
jgi:hypothetical protein